MEKKFLIVDQAILPEVFSKVLRAKELLASGAAKNVSVAAKMVDLSRSAFYKYKDSVFDFENAKAIVTVKAVLLDETGALQNLLGEHRDHQPVRAGERHGGGLGDAAHRRDADADRRCAALDPEPAHGGQHPADGKGAVRGGMPAGRPVRGSCRGKGERAR